VTGEHLFELHDTFGMPLELSLEEAARKDYPLAPDWRATFDALMTEQQNRSRAAGAGAAAAHPTR
jgi:alanyl-tRNA synthetase